MENGKQRIERIVLRYELSYFNIICFGILRFELERKVANEIIYPKTFVRLILVVIFFSIIQLLFQVAFTTAFPLGVIPVDAEVLCNIILVGLVIEYHHKLVHALHQNTKQ